MYSTVCYVYCDMLNENSFSVVFNPLRFIDSIENIQLYIRWLRIFSKEMLSYYLADVWLFFFLFCIPNFSLYLFYNNTVKVNSVKQIDKNKNK